MRLRPEHPALHDARTFRVQMVKRVDQTSRLLKPVADNRKLGAGGNFVTKGKWRGMPMYGLTLEERATCSRDCKQWANCFGNNMQFAHRIDHTDERFLETLEREVKSLDAMHPYGFVVRLHVLGDFYSPEYVDFWRTLTDSYRSLRVFGYTHWHSGPIYERIADWNSETVWVRFSDRGGEMSANVDGEGIQCPEQTGKTKSCLTCGICWSTTKAISFKEH